MYNSCMGSMILLSSNIDRKYKYSKPILWVGSFIEQSHSHSLVVKQLARHIAEIKFVGKPLSLNSGKFVRVLICVDIGM